MNIKMQCAYMRVVGYFENNANKKVICFTQIFEGNMWLHMRDYCWPRCKLGESPHTGNGVSSQVPTTRAPKIVFNGRRGKFYCTFT